MNFAVDHRYVDGGRCKNLIPSFLSIFENPEQFLRAGKKTIQENKKLDWFYIYQSLWKLNKCDSYIWWYL